MIFTNGFPKSGCHALVKAVQLLGQPCDVNHVPYGGEIPDGAHHIFITRDPRNVCLSWLRFRGDPETPGIFLTYFRRFDDGGSLIERLGAFEGWLNNPSVYVVRFEDLIAFDVVMRSIASWLGVPYLDGAWESLPGLTYSWTGRYSDYRTIWTPEVDAVWHAEGGPELLSRWGY